MVLIFCTVILSTPADQLPHAEILRKASFTGLLVTVAGALFLFAVRLMGNGIATFFEDAFSIVSKGLGHAVGEKIRTFRTGLDTLRTPADFAITMGVSLVMWVLIALAYLEVTTAFVASPELKGLTLAKCMLLMASGMAASSLQLPIIGWFTQIGLVEEAMRNFFGVAPEAATACAATLLLVSFLSIAPIGLVWARFEHVSLRKIAKESEQAGETLAAEEPAG
jgi:hypothetical protein